MSRLDEFLPEHDVRERHERFVRAQPDMAVAAALGISVAPISAVEAAPDESMLATETRVGAMDAASRRAFRAYWLAVGPFSALIRRRCLRAAERALG